MRCLTILIWLTMAIAPLCASSVHAEGIGADQLPMVAQTIYGSWSKERLVLPDTVGWSGSAFVLEQDGSDLILVTNRHCLGLDEIAASPDIRLPELPQEGGDLGGMIGSTADLLIGNVEEVVNPTIGISGYGLFVRFDSGAEVEVESFRYAPERDIALIRVTAEALEEGVDYLIPSRDDNPVEIGWEAAAVGAPYALGSSVTFGRVSAIRHAPSSYGETDVAYIQTDAAINRGNSGGPLMVSSDGLGYFLAGINTMKHAGEGLGFALDISEVTRSSLSPWFPADASGAVAALEESI